MLLGIKRVKLYIKAQNHHPKETRNLYDIEYLFISRLQETVKNKVFKNNTMHKLVLLH